MNFLYFLLLVFCVLPIKNAQKIMCPVFKSPLCITICDPSCEEKNPYEKLVCREACIGEKCACKFGYIRDAMVGGCVGEKICPGGESSFVVNKAHYNVGFSSDTTIEKTVTPNITITSTTSEPESTTEWLKWSEELVS